MRSKPPQRPGGNRSGQGGKPPHGSAGTPDPRGPGTRGPGAKGGGFRAPGPGGAATPVRAASGPARSGAQYAKPARPSNPDRAPAPPHGRPPRSAVPHRADASRPAAPSPVARPDPDAPPRLSLPSGPTARGPAAPKGGVWLHGQHAIAAALRNPNRRLRRLLLTDEAEAALAARTPQPWPLAPERTDRARLDHLLGRDTVHQGAALLADPLAAPALTQLLERPGPVLVLDQVTDPRNIGAVLRSAAAFGAVAVVTQDRNSPEETGVLAKAASGALETVPLLRAVNLARTLVALKAAGLWVIGLDAGAPALSGPALAERRVVLVLGGEGAGLRRLTKETCDELAGLAMPGAMESLNVSAAATVALYELARR